VFDHGGRRVFEKRGGTQRHEDSDMLTQPSLKSVEKEEASPCVCSDDQNSLFLEGGTVRRLRQGQMAKLKEECRARHPKRDGRDLLQVGQAPRPKISIKTIGRKTFRELPSIAKGVGILRKGKGKG